MGAREHLATTAVRTASRETSAVRGSDPTVVPTPETGPDQPFEPAPIIPDPNPVPSPAPIIPDPDPNLEPAPVIPDPNRLAAIAV